MIHYDIDTTENAYCNLVGDVESLIELKQILFKNATICFAIHTMQQLHKDNCEEQIEDKCYRCELGYVLTKGECIQETGECHIKTSKSCEECTNSNQITTSGKCETMDKCSYSSNDGTNNKIKGVVINKPPKLLSNPLLLIADIS